MQRRQTVSAWIDPPLSIPSARLSTFQPLAATVVKPFESFTSTTTTLLVQRHSDNEKVVLKLADRGLGYRSNKDSLDTVPWTLSIDDHDVRAVQAGAIPDWSEVISDFDAEFWEY